MRPVPPLRLDAATIDAVARRVVELLRAADAVPGPLWVDAAEIARRFGVERSWVYAHAARLGGVRLGDGPRGRLRFDPQLVARALAAAPGVPQAVPPATRPPKRRAQGEGPLLPVHPPR
jgi:hypothetical protein